MNVGKPGWFAELKRRNVLRAAALYAGAVWVIAQGIAQLAPAVGLPDWATRAFLIAAVLGFPFWLVFAWIYEVTPEGIRRDSDVPPDASLARRTGRKLDFAIIGVLAVAVALLLGNQFLWHKGARAVAASAAPAIAIPASAPATVPPAPTSAIPAKSVAVLPFANESGKTDEQFFSDGLSDDLINALSQFDGLKVISRNSAFQFRDSKDSSAEIGKRLGVAHLLEGSVQRAGDAVRITATLVNATDGSILWSARYDKPYKDLFALQDAITQAVADALKAKLLTTPGAVVQSDRPPSGNLAAWNAYSRGVAYIQLNSEQSLRDAIAAFGEATRLDPRYAAAYAQMSRSWSVLAIQFLGGAPAGQAYTKASEAMQTALKLDPESSLAHQARSLLLGTQMDWAGAESEAQRALQLAPNSGQAKFHLGFALGALGQNRRAVALMRQALQADPRNALWHDFLAFYLTALGQLDEAQQAAAIAIALQPGSTVYNTELAVIEILRGNAKAALDAANRTPSAGGWLAGKRALALQIGSDHAAADDALRKMIAEHAGNAYQIAEIYALRRDPDNTFKWLDRALVVHDSPGIRGLLSDPFILRYRNAPRFAAFCRKVGLPTTTDAKAMP